eukprot:2124659-Amphidinium_carterae.1
MAIVNRPVSVFKEKKLQPSYSCTGKVCAAGIVLGEVLVFASLDVCFRAVICCLEELDAYFENRCERIP